MSVISVIVAVVIVVFSVSATVISLWWNDRDF